MATIRFNDTPIDNQVWSTIAHSHCSKDYESYLELRDKHVKKVCSLWQS